MHGSGELSERVLILTPTGKDAPLVASALSPTFGVEICSGPQALGAALTQGVGAVLIAEEAITPELLGELVAGVDRQEPWSDVPFVVLAGRPPARNLPDWAERDVLRQLEPLGNVTVIERPVRIRTLVGVVRVALESRRRQQQMRVLHESVQALNHGKDQFLAMLGHELRNPLSAVRTALGVLQHPKNRTQDPRLGRCLDIIDRQSLAMGRMLEDLLDVSRVSLGKVRLEWQQVELAHLVRSAVETLQQAAHAQGQSLTVSGPREGLRLRGDPVRLEQVTNNVVGNALKYTPRGGNIQVTLGRDGPDAVLSVKDDGIGLEPDLLPKVFDLFTQGRMGLDRAQGGLGVGLALVDNLVRMHGGRVAVTSEGAGKGCEFRIHLPLLDGAHPSAEAEMTSNDDAEASSLRVLLVEDNGDIRETLGELLEEMGYHVASAACGLEAVALAQSSTPDLLLVDIGLPDIDGLEVARRVRASCSADLHLVALTGYGMAEDHRRSREAGFDDHLVKPLDPDELERLLARVAGRLGRGRSEAS